MDEAADANAMRLVRTTVELEEQARTMARRLIESNVACCVHTQRIQSTYRWEGTLTEANEWLVEARTLEAQAEACWLAMKEKHPYDVPMVEIGPQTRVNGSYARWAAEATMGQ